MTAHRPLDGCTLARAVAFTLALALPARAEDPKPAPAVAAPALPASAFQPAQVLLAKLDELDARRERLILASLEATRVAPREDHPESVSIQIELRLTALDVQQSREAVTEWIRLLTQEKPVVDARIVEDAKAAESANARQVRVLVDWDPAKTSPRGSKRPGASADVDPGSYIRKQACVDRVDIGDVSANGATQRIPGTDWMEERWTIRSREPARAHPPLRIHNYATVLERDHPYATVTRYSMLPAQDAWYRMELELTLLRPARAHELAGTSGKR
jgi:hypothetical protein